MSDKVRKSWNWDCEFLRYERELYSEGFTRVSGVDEAGRGPLAGPVVAAAVVLPRNIEIPPVFDSKQLSENQRDELRGLLEELPGVEISVGISTVEEIDKINILYATHLAMRRAVEKLSSVDFVLVDGLPVKGLPVSSKNVIKGDATCASIAAASIVAKVYRDNYMLELDAKYPQYGFASNKGYGTAEHLEALVKYGVSLVHRKSFRPVREILKPLPEQMDLL